MTNKPLPAGLYDEEDFYGRNMHNQPIGSTLGVIKQLAPKKLMFPSNPYTDILRTACLFALHVLKQPCPTPENNQATIAYIEHALKVTGGVEE